MSIVHPNPLEVAAADAILEDSPTEVVMDDIVASTTAINEASDQVSEISRNVEELGNAAVSVEAFSTQFLDKVSCENWSPKMAHQYQIGMESILKACGVNVPPSVYCASFEAAGVTQTNEENRNETKGKSEGVIKRLWASFLEMLTKLWDNIQNFTAFLGVSAGKMRKVAGNLKARVTKAKVDGLVAPEDHKVSGAWASYLADDIGGGASAVHGDPAAALHKMSEKAIGFSTAWHDNYLKAVTEMAEGNFASMDTSGSGDALQSLNDSLKELLSPVISKYNGAWPGGYTVLVQRNPQHLDRFDLKVTHKPERGIEADVLSFAQINTVANEIQIIARAVDDEMRNLQKGKAKIEAVKRKMETAIKGGEKPINGNVLKLASALTSDLMTGPRKVLPMLTTACSKAAQHCDASLRVYKAPGKAAAK